MIPEITVNFESLNIGTIAPMFSLIVGGLLILCIDLINKNLDKSLYIMLGVLFLFIDFGLLVGYEDEIRGMFDLVLIDGISVLSQSIIIISSVMFLLLSMTKLRFHEAQYPEYFALYLFMVSGLQFMVSSDSLILIFVGLETSSMALYTMIAMHNRANAIEAAIKYFTMGALATAFFAFGSLIFYFLTGSVNINEISKVLISNDFSNYATILVGVVFILAALAFKLSIVPFHTWIPDVYEGATSALAGFISIVPKIAGFVVAIRFFEVFVSIQDPWVTVILYVIVVLSMTIPNIIALLQDDINRMLAYSSISNAGFAMGAILVGTQQATSGIFLYWILFFVTNFGAFSMLWMRRNKDYTTFTSDHSLEKYKGFVHTSPIPASIIALFLLSLAGIPPFALFWGKMYLLGAAINAGYVVLAIIMALNSAVAAFYYIKPIVYMFLKQNDTCDRIYMQNATKVTRTLVGISAFFVLLSIFFIEPLLEIINYFLRTSGF